MEDKCITTGRFTTHYLVGGKGLPLVLVHGITTTAEGAWKYNLPSLTQHHRVYAPDLIGHGKSDKPLIDYTLPFFTAFFGQFVEALGLDKFNLVGHSFGGNIALAFSLNNPSKIGKLVLIDSSGISTDTTWVGRLLLSLFKIRARINKDYTYLSIVRNGDKTTHTFCDRLSEIMAPTLIVWGKQDVIIPVKYAFKAHNLIKDSHLRIFDHSWHSPHREHPEEFNHLVLEFLSNT
jgi:4,5:9,10-diseco-3-hydroxy-5,9,17-trioxoandrosta-1(10),2-diene-4-oate hydrolase